MNCSCFQKLTRHLLEKGGGGELVNASRNTRKMVKEHLFLEKCQYQKND
jgi:hypothetical protein